MLPLRQPARLPEQVADILAGRIESGELAPGEMLPSEAELARRFGVSRPVIREALSRLKFEGMVDSHQGRGVQVVGPVRHQAFRVAEAQRLSLEDLASLYELRAILESEAAALAALRCSGDQLAALRGNVAEMAEAVANDTDGSQPDAAFHLGIAEGSGNPHLSELMRFLHDRLAAVIIRARDNSQRQDGLPALVQTEHEAMLAALEGRDPAKAREAALAHLKNAAKRLGLEIF